MSVVVCIFRAGFHRIHLITIPGDAPVGIFFLVPTIFNFLLDVPHQFDYQRRIKWRRIGSLGKTGESGWRWEEGEKRVSENPSNLDR
jgi:hypothetical protein